MASQLEPFPEAREVLRRQCTLNRWTPVRKVRSLLVVGTLALSVCNMGAYQSIVVAPRLVVRADSASRAAFTTSVLAAMQRVARDDSLFRYFGPPHGRHDYWLACFGYAGFWSGFTYCGRMQDSVVRIAFSEDGLGYYRRTFDDRSERIRRHLIQALHAEFGDRWGWECERSWSKPEPCPRPAHIDSGA